MITPEAFRTICDEAYRMGVPRGSERAILREYLQCAVLALLVELSGAASLAFIGGTALRLLYGLDRFSEDLDFDNCGFEPEEPLSLFREVTDQLAACGLSVRFRVRNTRNDRGGTLVVHDLLHELNLSPHHDETMAIKLEYTTPEQILERTTAVLHRFGFTAQVQTEPLPVLCARKVMALLNRKRLQPRDLYDLHWFLSRRILPDDLTLAAHGVPSYNEATRRIVETITARAPQLAEDARDLTPMLLNLERAAVIRALPETIESLLIPTA